MACVANGQEGEGYFSGKVYMAAAAFQKAAISKPRDINHLPSLTKITRPARLACYLRSVIFPNHVNLNWAFDIRQ
jgi:hypothetical protein